MANSNRTALLNKTHRVLKQQFKPIVPPGDRPLLEHMLFACCLENAPFDTAERIYEHLGKSFFDWNEVRVSTLTELTEAMHGLPDPLAAASNLKRILQGVFESTYSFELEIVKKQNIGQAIKHLERLGGASPFVLAYVTQSALAGHAIPLDRGALDVLFVLGIITESESKSGKVSGLERVIPKNKGIEFSSLLHHLVAEYVANPFSPTVRKLILAINPDAKDRFPKRHVKKELDKPSEPAAASAAKKKAPSEKPAEKPAAKSAEKPAEKSAEKPADKPVEKSPDKPAEKHVERSAVKLSPRPAEKSPEKHAEKHPERSAEKPRDKKRSAPAASKAPLKHQPASPKRKPAAKPIAKRKPR